MNCKTVQINKRFNGPPNSGNGGYTAGLLAKELADDTVKVVLRMPPPLDRDLLINRDDSGVSLLDGEQLIASAVPGTLDFAVPQCPSMSQIKNAEYRYASCEQHVQPVCFVCGPAREPGDGLRIFASPIDGAANCVAGLWQPHHSLDDGGGQVACEFVWAALDCPGYYAHRTDNALMLLGTITATIHQTPKIGQPVIVTGWQLEVSGRKHLSGTALFDEHGTVYAKSHQVWILVRDG